MSTLYLRLPSKAAAEAVEHWLGLPCPFALATGEAVEREGVAPIAELGETIAAAKKVVLLLAAGDVTVLRVKTPPLPAPKLKLALPNLIEDQLIVDPAECVIAAGDVVDGLRTVAVAQRGWLEILGKALIGLGAANLTAIPSQFCLPHHTGRVTAAVTEFGSDVDIALRLDEAGGIGLTIRPEAAPGAAAEVAAAVRMLVPEIPLTLYLPQARVSEYRAALEAEHWELFADAWSARIAAANRQSWNLLAGLIGDGDGARAVWRAWRWPLALAASVLAINAIGLNADWWRLKHEAANLRTGMIQTYRATYPKDTVILDPLAQMQKKVATAERNGGQAVPDEFGQIAASFGEAVGEQLRAEGVNGSPFVSLEYRDRGLLVHLKPDIHLSADSLKIALAARNLSLASQSGNVWQIRSAQ